MSCSTEEGSSILVFYQETMDSFFLLEPGPCRSSILLGTAGQIPEPECLLHTIHTQESVFEEGIGLIRDLSGGTWPPPAASSSQWMPLSSSHAFFLKGVLPASPLYMTLLDQLESDLNLSIQEADRMKRPSRIHWKRWRDMVTDQNES